MQDTTDLAASPPGLRRRRAIGLAAALVCTGPGSILAHGDRPHDKSAPARREQKDWGIAGEARRARRVVEVRMDDRMRFTPDQLDVVLGETIRFVVHNDGREMHEFVIGTREENARHAELMVKFPGMEHDEPYMAHVPPGQRGEIVWTFNRAGEFEFACLIAGHFQAGMKGTLRVAARRPA